MRVLRTMKEEESSEIDKNKTTCFSQYNYFINRWICVTIFFSFFVAHAMVRSILFMHVMPASPYTTIDYLSQLVFNSFHFFFVETNIIRNEFYWKNEQMNSYNIRIYTTSTVDFTICNFQYMRNYLTLSMFSDHIEIQPRVQNLSRGFNSFNT